MTTNASPATTPPPDETESQPDHSVARLLKWWHFGLIGGVVLSIATVIKIFKSLPALLAGELSWSGFFYFPIAIFAMGFACGVLVWLALPLSRRLGLLGDAIIGAVTMPFFFVLCMLIFDSSLLTTKLKQGLIMLGFGVLLGAFMGLYVGSDVRKGNKFQKVNRGGPFAR
jgi:hypothetical protein